MQSIMAFHCISYWSISAGYISILSYRKGSQHVITSLNLDFRNLFSIAARAGDEQQYCSCFGAKPLIVLFSEEFKAARSAYTSRFCSV